MVEFDSLPQNSRLLILATLELEIASENCKSIFDLARKRFQTIDQVWRDVCKKTALPRCTMPPRVMGNDCAGGPATNVFVFGDASANASVFGGAPAQAKAPSPAPAAPPAPIANAKPVNPTATVAPTAVASLAPAGRPPKKQNWAVAVAVGVAAVFLLGIGIAVFAIPRSTQTPYASTVTRPNETARPGGNKPTVDNNVVPMPEGTTRRLDAINKSFSKQ